MLLYDWTTAPLGILGRVLCRRACTLGSVGGNSPVGSSPWEPRRGQLGQELSEGCCEHLQPTDGAAGNCHECGDRESQVPPPISPPYLSYLYSSVLFPPPFWPSCRLSFFISYLPSLLLNVLHSFSGYSCLICLYTEPEVNQRTNSMGFCSHEVPRGVKSIETESRAAGARGKGWGVSA